MSISTPYNEFWPAQNDFLHVPDRSVDTDICLYQGGFGSGKTFIGSLLGILLSQKYPGVPGLVTAQHMPLLKRTTLKAYIQHLRNFGFRKGKDYSWNNQTSTLTLHCYDDSEILFTYLSDPDQLKSYNAGWAHIEEMSQISEAAFDAVIGRVRDPRMQVNRIFGTSNPQQVRGFIYNEFKLKAGMRVIELDGGPPSRINYRRIIAPTTENKALKRSYVAGMQAKYDPEYYRINVLGEDGDYTAGLVCKNWSSIANVRDIAYNPEAKLYLTCDFNVDPMCWALAHIRMVDNQRHYDFCDEIVIENTNIIETVKEFARRYGNHRAGIIVTGDASGNARTDGTPDPNQTRYALLLKTLSDLGVTNFALDAPRANPLIESRIEVWNSFICNQKGERRIAVDPRCKQIIKVCENLKYITGSSKIWQPTPKQIELDNKQKFERQDMFDAASYLVNRYDPRIVKDGNRDKEPPPIIFDV